MNFIRLLSGVFPVLTLGGCGEGSSSSPVEENSLSTVQEAISQSSELKDPNWFQGPSFDEMYFADGRIKPSSQLTAEGHVRHPWERGSCDSGPVWDGRESVTELMESLSPAQKRCRSGAMKFREVLPLTSHKDFEIAKIPGFLRKENGPSYVFEYECPDSLHGITAYVGDPSVSNLRDTAKMWQDCTWQKYIEENSRPVTHDDLLGR